MKITIYTKKDCHLCEEAKAILSRFAHEYPLSVDEIDIESDSATFEKYRYEIPVVLLNDRKIFKYRIDEKKFHRILREAAIRQQHPEG
jgi:glutaredoxin